MSNSFEGAVKLKQEDGEFSLYLNGQKIKYVRDIMISQGIDEHTEKIAIVNVELYVNTDV